MKSRQVRKTINTYSPEKFRNKYIRSSNELDTLLKNEYARFFLVRVQDLIRMISLPVPPVRTTNHTLIYLTNGEATITVGSEFYRILKDDCLFVPAGQVYSFAKHDKNKGFICNFRNDFLVGKIGTAQLTNEFEFLKVWGNPLVRLDAIGSAHVRVLFERIFRAYSISGLANLDVLQSTFIALLCEIKHYYETNPQRHNANAKSITNRFKELVFNNFRTRQLVSDYAGLLNISPNHLNKVVKHTSGKSPTKWIDEAIVLEAKVLLHQTDLTISEVGAQVGIIDQAYFSRLFKKYESLSPLQFRQKVEKSHKGGS